MGKHVSSELDKFKNDLPSVEQLQIERKRHKGVLLRRTVLGIVLGVLVAVALATALLVSFVTPVYSIYGESMSPTLEKGDTVVCTSSSQYEPGDIVAFTLDNKILIKRVVATSGQTVDIDGAGNVYIDGALLEEPYAVEKSLEYCDIALPCEVPEGSLFVLGDNRPDSADSRSASVGFVSQDQVVGKLKWRIMPLSQFGSIE